MLFRSRIIPPAPWGSSVRPSINLQHLLDLSRRFNNLNPRPPTEPLPLLAPLRPINIALRIPQLPLHTQHNLAYGANTWLLNRLRRSKDGEACIRMCSMIAAHVRDELSDLLRGPVEVLVGAGVSMDDCAATSVVEGVFCAHPDGFRR